MHNAVRRIEEVFWEAAQLAPGEQRDAYLAHACGDDRALRQRVERLLAAQPKAEAFLERPFPGPGQFPTADEPQLAEQPGTAIGPYRLLEQIGEGGMGLVFVAAQTRPVRRRVALKVVKPGMDTRQVVARFEQERQALALMDHPHIAKVFDAGTTASGRPYFVMELVRGVPITQFCDEHRLATRQRLELFIPVCQAVQHAHQKGIIHRDLKPSNILVTLHDTVAVPKVIDFGIAKATTGPLTDRTVYTNLAQLVGTPLYMSPEQAEMNGLDVDTRSDVYSLGVLLYELLTGTTPFESETLKALGLDEIRRKIREEEPPTPSQRCNTLSAQLCSTVSERRGVDGRRLGQVLRGELDWVVMKALEKDRNRRYESASAFAADVQRYLSDEAVAACSPSAGYRLRKYVRRHRRVLATVVVIAVALTAATAVSTWQAVVAREAQRQAEDDRDRAQSAESQAKAEQDRAEGAERRAATEAAIARAVNAFLQTDVLEQADGVPETIVDFEIDPHLTMREALDRAGARIGQRFQGQPLVEAAIRTSIGNAYRQLHSFPQAVPHLERAVALREAHLGPDHPDTLASMDSLAHACQWSGRHQQSIALRQRMLENNTAKFGPDAAPTLGCVRILAEAYQFGGQYETSERLLKQLLEKQSTILGPTHGGTLSIMSALAALYRVTDQPTESMALYEKVLALRKNPLGPENYPIYELNGCAEVCQRAGKLDQADRLLHKALEQERDEKDSPSRRNAMANTLGWLAVNLLLQERYAEAEPLARQSVAMNQIGDPKGCYWVSVLGAVLLGQQKYAEAEPFLLKGYEGMKQNEPVHPVVRRRMAEVAGWLVRLYEATNQPEKARAWREKLKATVK
jgi:serine/threonine protein kinase/Tfp pilus assembly protein PilO